MIANYQIREKIASYLGNKLALDSFEDWLVQQSWNMHRDASREAQELVSAVELRLAEYSSGHLSEEQLRAELLPFVTSYLVPVSLNKGVIISMSANNNSIISIFPAAFQVAFPAEGNPAEALFAGTSHGVVFA